MPDSTPLVHPSTAWRSKTIENWDLADYSNFLGNVIERWCDAENPINCKGCPLRTDENDRECGGYLIRRIVGEWDKGRYAIEPDGAILELKGAML